MHAHRRSTLLLLVFFVSFHAPARQWRVFPAAESFDTVVVPALPAGWRTSTARSAGGDFVTTRSAFHSESTAVVSTNATVAQWLATPALDLSAWEPESLIFHERRSSTHTSGVVVEASADGGTTFPYLLGDTLRNPGTTSYLRRALALPHALAGAPAALLRWRVSGGSGGTSATFRIDDVLITARGRWDIAVTSIRITPELPLRGEAVTAEVAVRNVGRESAGAWSVRIGVDRDHDLRIGPEETAAELPFDLAPLPGDSVVASAALPPSPFPADTIVASLAASWDLNPSNDRRVLRRTTGVARASVVINELMAAPAAPGPEWIELLSTLPETLSVGDWALHDRSAANLHRIPPTTVIPPGGYVVLTRDSGALAGFWPDAAGVVALSDLPSAFLNNDSDAVVLLDHRGAAMDSVRYAAHWWAGGGTSLERVEATGPSLDSANWAPCPSPRGGTPGARNERTPLDTNARAARLTTALQGDSVTGLSLIAANIGRSPILLVGAAVTREDGISPSVAPEEGLPVWLAPEESLEIRFPASGLAPGDAQIVGAIHAAGDARSADDTIRARLSLSYPAQTLRINEIMYAPPSGLSEYVEYVVGVPVDAARWSVGSRRRPGANVLSDLPVALEPGDHLVIAGDSSILAAFPELETSGTRLIVRGKALGLGDAGDTLLLFDPSGHLIDSVVYDPSWHNPDLVETRGRSLERISPLLPASARSNWSTCADASGGTPGRRNSLAIAAASAPAAALSCEPNPFSPDGDGHEDLTMITYRLGLSSGIRRVRIFDRRGREIRTLSGEEPTGGTGTLVWDGRDDDGIVVPMGIYVLLIEARDGASGEEELVKGVVVVAAKL